MADAKLRNRQESTDSVSSSSNTAEDFSEDDKDNEMDDLHIIKTVGKYKIIDSKILILKY